MLSQGMQIFIKGICGQTVTAKVEPHFTISDLKELMCFGQCRHAEGSVGHIGGIPPPLVRIIFCGRDMEDQRTLKDYKVQSESTLHLCVRPCLSHVLVTKDWDRFGEHPRFIPTAWAYSNGTGRTLKNWVAKVAGISPTELTLLTAFGDVITDDFQNWQSLCSSEECAIRLSAHRDLSDLQSTARDVSISACLAKHVATLPFVADWLTKDLSQFEQRKDIHSADFNAVSCAI